MSDNQEQPCRKCGKVLVVINIEVDGRKLIMESCDNCDVRSWRSGGSNIDLDGVLTTFGQSSPRRR